MNETPKNNQETKNISSSVKKNSPYTAPEWSDKVYIRITPSDVFMFRFYLEAYDNLGIMTVVDRWGTALKIRFSPNQREELLNALYGMQKSVSFEIITVIS